MTTSPNSTEYIESYLVSAMAPEENLLAEARQLTDVNFAKRVAAQRKVHVVARHYGRQKLRMKLLSIHRNLFTNPTKASFIQSVVSLFEKR